jgi:hypothetical protein
MRSRTPSPVTTLVVGLVFAVAAGGCWALSSTASDKQTVLNEAYTIAKSEPVREEFAWQIAEAIAPHSATSAPSTLNLANEVARKTVASPAFQQAFATALPAIYAQIVEGAPGDVVLDPALVQQAFASVGATPPANLQLIAFRDKMPDLRGPIDVVHTMAGVLGALGAVFIGFGLAMAPHRGRAIMRIGRWLITTGLVTIVLFWALPALALLPLGGWIGVVGIILATGDWLVVPALVLAAFGIAILVVGRAGEAETRRRALAIIPNHIGRAGTRSSVG